MNQQSPRVPLDVGREPLRFTPGTAEVGSSSLTYEPYYGLKEKAFSLSADPRFLYQSPAHAPAFEELLTGIRRREGLIVLTGEIGTGKTTLIRSVLEHLDRRTFTAFVPDPFVSREDLLKMLLVDFGVVSIADLKQGSLAGASRPDLSYPLYEFLDALVPLQAFAVLIIDEAQNLPLPLLEEIRILSDLEQREKLLQVVLVGQPELRAHLKMPEMRQVNQRVSVRCELAALDQQHVGEYVKHRLTVASGGESRIEFSAAAISALFAASGGVPRVINLLCDRALQRGQISHATLIDAVLIEEATEALGLEAVPTSDTVTPTTAAQRRDTSDTGPPAGPSPIVQASAVPIVPVDIGPLSRQFLAEFATEEESAQGLGPGVRLWRLVASLLAAALAAAGTAAAAYLYLTGPTIDLSASTLPPSPTWTYAVSTVDAVPSVANPSSPSAGTERTQAASASATSPRFSIQVASFGSRTRADRLVEELTAAGLQPQVVEIGSPSSATILLQVRVEGYTTLEDASRDLARIREIPGYADARLVAN